MGINDTRDPLEVAEAVIAESVLVTKNSPLVFKNELLLALEVKRYRDAEAALQKLREADPDYRRVMFEAGLVPYETVDGVECDGNGRELPDER